MIFLNKSLSESILQKFDDGINNLRRDWRCWRSYLSQTLIVLAIPEDCIDSRQMLLSSHPLIRTWAVCMWPDDPQAAEFRQAIDPSRYGVSDPGKSREISSGAYPGQKVNRGFPELLPKFGP